MLRNTLNHINNFKNFIHYFKFSFAKNAYPCLLLGEKIIFNDNNIFITFRMVGQKNSFCHPLHDLLSHEEVLSYFSPIDAVKIGKMAFNNFIIQNNEDPIQKFNHIKDKIKKHHSNLNHIFSLNENDKNTRLLNEKISSSFGIKETSTNNKYPFRFLGFSESKSSIRIIYNINEKRSGYYQSLENILKNKSILKKFHPNDAIKFGFIDAGKNFFTVL